MDEQRRRVPKAAINNPRVLNSPTDYPSPVSFARGMRVATNNCVTLYISGTASVGADGASLYPGDITRQTQRTFENIAALLESESADWHDVVRTTCYLDDFRYYDAFNDVRNRFYTEQRLDPLPASTCIQARLCRPELLVEIEAIAIIPKDRAPAAGFE